MGISKIQKRRPFIIVAVAVFLVLAVWVGVYHTPENRLQRQLDLGRKYLEEQQYKAAILAFEKAIAIDGRCMEAYMGGVEAYLGTGDMDAARTFYDSTLTMLSDLDEEFVRNSMDSIVEIYLAADRLYGKEPDRLAQIWEDAYARTEGNLRIKDKMTALSIKMAEQKAQKGKYEEALAIYDRLIEFDAENEKMRTSLEKVLEQYLDILLKTKDYDKISALVEKYREIAVGIDFDAYLRRPYAEEHELEFEELKDMELPFLVEYIDNMETWEVIELEGAGIEPGLIHYSIDEIKKTPSAQEGDVDIILSYTTTGAPRFYGTEDAFAGEWYWACTESVFDVGDYFTGLILSTEEEAQEKKTDFEWNEKSYSAKVVWNVERDDYLLDWEYDGNDVYTQTMDHTATYTYTITVPEDYDGLALRISRNGPRELANPNEPVDTKEKYLWEEDEEYMYFRIGDLFP